MEELPPLIASSWALASRTENKYDWMRAIRAISIWADHLRCHRLPDSDSATLLWNIAVRRMACRHEPCC